MTTLKLHMIPWFLFIVAGIAEVALLVIGETTLASYLKPALIPLLLVTALITMSETRTDFMTPIARLLTWALIFHTIGDVLLIFPGEWFFLGGVAAFLIGHIFYLLLICKGLKGFTFLEGLVATIPVLVVYPLALLFRQDDLFITIGIAIYALALLGYLAFGYVGLLQKNKLYRYFIWGGLIFIISDTIVALDRFLGIGFPYQDAATMATYIIAEMVLCLGACRVKVVSRR